MQTVVLVIHMLLAIGLVGVVLLQRSEGGGLSGGGSSNALLSVRAGGNLLTRITAILATGFIITSLLLGYLSSAHHVDSASRLEQLIEQSQKQSTSPAALAPSPQTLTPAVPSDNRPAPAK